VDLPSGSLVGGIVRRSAPILPRGDTVLRTGARIVVFSLPEHISSIENAFGGEES